MSPEQATGDGSPDARSDIYPLGAVGYYLLAARPPFEGDKPIKVVIAHSHEQVVPPPRHREGIPPDLEQVILRCLAKAPTDRFQDAASLAEALAGCQAARHWRFGPNQNTLKWVVACRTPLKRPIPWNEPRPAATTLPSCNPSCPNSNRQPVS